MKKALVAALFVVSLSVPAFSLEVDRNELQSAGAGSVEFVNYVGPHAVVSTAEEISGIGTSLGTGLIAAGSTGDGAKYRIIHAVDASVKTGLDADILILGANAGVDHIDNIRRILTGYLEEAYGYSQKDAATLAIYVTVYNAVNRGKLDSIQAKYKPVVTGYLSADKFGLSLRFDEWAGKSQIVVPLSDARLSGTISAIDTSSLTSTEVVGSLKEDPNAAVDTRKDMVDLKEREAAAAQERAEAAQKEAASTKAEAAVADKELQKAKEEAAEAQKAADDAAREAQANPTDEAAQAKAEDANKAARDKQAAVGEKQQATEATKKAIAESEKNAAADQKLADTKEKEAQTERKDIAVDVQKQVDQNAAAAAASEKSALDQANPAFALRITDEKTILAELQLVDLNSGKILKTSSLNSIRNRTLVDTGNGLMAVAGKKGGNATVRLVLVDPATLDILKEGSELIAEPSMLVRANNDYYAVIDTGSGAALGRFDANLAVKAQSTINVLASTVITVTEKGVLVQSAEGAIKLLRATDLVDLSGK